MFACLPMALRYGQMVNFEPCVLMPILAALLCLGRWKLSAKTLWQYCTVVLPLPGLWVDWAMHIFVLAICVCWLMRAPETKRLTGTLLIVAVLSVIVDLARIQLLRPDVWMAAMTARSDLQIAAGQETVFQRGQFFIVPLASESTGSQTAAGKGFDWQAVRPRCHSSDLTIRACDILRDASSNPFAFK